MQKLLKPFGMIFYARHTYYSFMSSFQEFIACTHELHSIPVQQSRWNQEGEVGMGCIMGHSNQKCKETLVKKDELLENKKC